jgi:hypothetical protein
MPVVVSWLFQQNSFDSDLVSVALDWLGEPKNESSRREQGIGVDACDSGQDR